MTDGTWPPPGEGDAQTPPTPPSEGDTQLPPTPEEGGMPPTEGGEE